MNVPDKFSLQDRVAVVTGSGRGIGKGIALTLAGVGAHVVNVARTVSEIEATAAEVRKLGRRSIAVPADIRLSDQIDNAIKRTLDEFGRIDIWVNNAGGGLPRSALEISERSWNTGITENLTSVFLCCKAVAKAMIEQKKGSIINISSVGGLRPAPNDCHYGAAKAGVISLTGSLAVEWAQYGIRVNCVAPGAVATPGWVDTTTPERREAAAVSIPLGRVGTPEDIGLAVAFFASDAAEWVTGQTLAVNGGPTKTR